MRICAFCPLFVPWAQQPVQFSASYFSQNNLCISYQMEGNFTGIINTLRSVVFVLLGLEEEIVWCKPSSWLAGQE